MQVNNKKRRSKRLYSVDTALKNLLILTILLMPTDEKI